MRAWLSVTMLLEGAEVFPWGPQPTKTPQGRSANAPPVLLLCIGLLASVPLLKPRKGAHCTCMHRERVGEGVACSTSVSVSIAKIPERGHIARACICADCLVLLFLTVLVRGLSLCWVRHVISVWTMFYRPLLSTQTGKGEHVQALGSDFVNKT